MKTTHFFQNVFVAITSLVAMFTIALIFESCQAHHNGGTCTYEGLECPNALAIWQRDSINMDKGEALVDSLYNVIDTLNTQLAGCELKDHSQIQEMVNSGVIHLTRDNRGFISVVYRESDGNEYALDYITDAEFYNKFGYQAKK